MDCFRQWCAECLQGVDYAFFTEEPGVYQFQPCGHRAAFYEFSDEVKR